MKDMKNFNQSNFTLSNSCTFNRSSVHISNLAPLSLRSCTFIRSSVYTSTLSSLHPWFLTGFADAEGSFTVSISKNKELKLGWGVRASFEIHLDIRDLDLLKRIQASLGGVGTIRESSKNDCIYKVRSIEDLKKVIAYLDLFPLITKKRSDYLLFKQAVELIDRKEHRTLEGLQKAVNIKASINKGLPEELKREFPETKPVPRPEVKFKCIPDPNWVVGFIEGEGCFYIDISKSSSSKMGERVALSVSVCQHTRDTVLMQSLIQYFNCGFYKGRPGRDWGEFMVKKLSDVTEKIIPFLDKYPLEGYKRLNYDDFVKVAILIKDKRHLIREGLEQIRKIKAGTNQGR